MTTPKSPARGYGWAGLAFTALLASVSAQNTPDHPRSHAVTGVRLEAGEDTPTYTLVLADGRIAAIQAAEEPVPTGVWHIDGEGLLALPVFVDAWTELGVGGEGPVIDRDRPADTGADVRIDMRVANRKGIQPASLAAAHLTLEDSTVEAHQKQGFGLALTAPTDQLLAGKSALVSLRPAATRDLVVRGEVFQHAGFRAGRGGYPGTLMAYHAQLRQFFLDAGHHATLRTRWAEGRSGPRPAWDPDLEEGAALLGGKPLVCQVESARDVNRWLRLADEIGLTITAFSGGRGAWKVSEKLVQRDIAVVLDLDWGDEVKELEEEDEELAAFDYRVPRAVRAEKRRLWEERRDNALRLHEAGVRVLFGTGEGKAKGLLKKLRTLVEAGLPREAALAALTQGAAELYGVERHYGGLRPGSSASLSLWTADPLTDEKAQVVWSIVEGYATEFEAEESKDSSDGEAPGDGVDISGLWTITEDDDEERPMTLSLEMDEEGGVEGSCETASPIDGSKLTATVTGTVSGDQVTLSMTFNVESMEVEVELRGTVEGDKMSGTNVIKLPGNEQEEDFEATRKPGGVR